MTERLPGGGPAADPPVDARTASAGATGPDPVDAPLRLGHPVELPWWAPAAMLPPGLTLAGAALPAPVEARLLDATVSLLMLAAVAVVSTRVRSRNLQSVWISAAYAFWCFPILIWVVEIGR